MTNNSDHTITTAKRFSTDELAHIEIYGQVGRILTRMGNLSDSGAFFEILTPNYSLKKGDVARITISLRSLNKTHVKECEVVWTKDLSVGVQFLSQEELQDKLTNVLFGPKN